LSEDFEPDLLVVPARLFSWVEPLVVAAAEEGPFVAVLAFFDFSVNRLVSSSDESESESGWERLTDLRGWLLESEENWKIDNENKK
jgi:hypothetical protein